jgi:Family of unknown function (DUF6166)
MERSNDVVYLGKRTNKGCEISHADPDYTPLKRIKLRDSLKLWNHSPTGFNWGYGGSGPAQTALALVLDWTGDAEVAKLLYQDFKFLIVAGLPSARGDFRFEGLPGL